MDQVLGVKFLNQVLENEFQRALKVLASSHDSRKNSVSLGFNGAGKRAVRVGYVVERPIWKTSYRLRLELTGNCRCKAGHWLKTPATTTGTTSAWSSSPANRSLSR